MVVRYERAEALVYAPQDHDHDHDHDHDTVLPLEDNPIWQQDNVTLHSVGMDIGSAGTQVLFSRLHLRRISEDLSSRYIVVRRETLHQSPVALTPYLEDGRNIDAEALGSIIDRAYDAARVDAAAIDTGVVILTGEALRRANAERIAGVLAERGGEFVTATAGHHMEAMLAAYGSGAAKRAYDDDLRLLNVDIGGGTTKLSLVDHGRVVGTAAVHIGGRLLVVDEDGRIVRLEPAGRRHAARAGHEIEIGDQVTPAMLDEVAESMADLLVEAITKQAASDAATDWFLTEPLPALGELDGALFSGGVAEYVYEREERDFGDLGPRLGRAMRLRVEDGRLPIELAEMGERIRATALGASEYSVQLSGNTTYISDPDAILPRRNLQVIRPRVELGEEIDPDTVSTAVTEHLAAFDAGRPGEEVGITIRWEGLPTYQRLAAFAEGLIGGLGSRAQGPEPVYLLLDGDVALSLGSLLLEEFGLDAPLAVIDGLRLDDFDYIDLSRLRQPSNTVAVTIKSLVFNQDPREPAPAGA